MAISAEHMSKFAYTYQHRDVSIWVKNSRVGQKTNQTNKLHFL